MQIHLRLVLVYLICLSSCSTDPKKAVEKYIYDLNRYDSINTTKALDGKFFIKNNPLVLGHHVSIDSFRAIGGKVRLLKISSQNNLVRTTEVWTSAYDSLLGITPQPILHSTYRLKKGRIESVSVDVAENLAEYRKEREIKANSFNYFLDYEYPNLSVTERQNQLISILTKYNKLSISERKEYAVRAYLKDSEFISTNNWLRMGLKFKGRSTVLTSAMGFTFPTTYTVDEDQLTIVPLAGGLPMSITIQDANTMIGESIQGEYVFKRVNK